MAACLAEGHPRVAAANAMDTGVALEAAESVQDHHDYAKRHRDLDGGLDGVEQEVAASPPPPAKRGRTLRDPEGGTYISARSRARKAPLPMKLRALPASFWEQPNLNKGPSPGTIFSALPPLCKDDEAVVSPMSRPSASPLPPHARDKDGGEDADGATVLVSHSPADTDLLFSLFRSVEPKGTERRTRTRGRPRRNAVAAGPGGVGAAPGAGGVGGPRDEDPCLLGSLTGGLLSVSSRHLSGLDCSRGVATLRGAVVGVGSVDNNNLAQILSDLVVKL